MLDPKTVNKEFKESQMDKYLITTLGRLIFNDILPSSFPYLNEPTTENLIGYTSDEYFVEKGIDVREFIKNVKLPEPLESNFIISYC